MGDTDTKVDYVLVTTRRILAKADNAMKIHNFMNALHESGVQVNIDFGQAYPDKLFIRLNIPNPLLDRLSALYHVELSYTNSNYIPERKPRFKIFQTELDLKEESSIVMRAPESVMDLRPTKPTNAERSMILYYLMSKTWFGKNAEDYGLEQLLSKGLLSAAYPVHEGQYEWTEEGPLSDRQLLAKYWANLLCIHKKQPLNLVEKYCGTEIAMYFAYIDYYFKYMIPAAIVGLLFYVVGFISASVNSYIMINDEVCTSDIKICPLCLDRTMCTYSNFSDHCRIEKTRAMLDNVFSVLFAIFTSVWAIFFVFFWKRNLNVFRMRWNVWRVRLEKGIRPEFTAKARRTRTNHATGVQEHYVPPYTRCFVLTSTYLCIVLIAIFFMLVAMGMVVYHNRLKFAVSSKNGKKKAILTQMVGNGILILIQMFMFSLTYPKIAYFFTTIEVPSTQYNFDNSYIVKYCILLFVNRYSAIIYLTFIKGRSYEHPGSVRKIGFLREITFDLCGPTGCFTDIGVALAVVFIASSIKAMLIQTLPLMAKAYFTRIMNRRLNKDSPQWELDYALVSNKRYQLLWEYFDLLIQYGYIVCFVCAFPLAPLLALVRVALEIRIDARKYIMYKKRYTPRKVRGMGSYNKLLNWITYIGVFVNACVIAFSSSFISWLLYKFYFRTEGGYYKFMLSKFDEADLPQSTPEDNGTCFYPGIRYPPNDVHKYQFKNEYYIILVTQLVFILVYEQLLIFLRAVLRAGVHEKPKRVREKMLHQEELVQEARQKILNDLYQQAASQRFSDNVTFPKRNR